MLDLCCNFLSKGDIKLRYSVYKFVKGISNSVVEAILHLKEHPESVNMLSDCTEAILAIKTALDENKEVCPNEVGNFFEKINEIVECIENNKSYIEKLDELYTYAVGINEYCKSEIKYINCIGFGFSYKHSPPLTP